MNDYILYCFQTPNEMMVKTLIYDLETSGFCPLPLTSKYHNVLQICAHCVETGETFTSFVKPQLAMVPTQSEAIHKISDDCVRDADDFTTVVNKMFETLGCNLEMDIIEMIAHNNDKFDEVLFRSLYANTLPETVTFWDTLPFLRLKYPKLTSYNLGKVYFHFYNTNFQNAHRADADVFALARIYKEKIQPFRKTFQRDEDVERIVKECLTSIHYIGPYRAELITKCTGAETVSQFEVFAKNAVARSLFALDVLLQDEIQMRNVQHRIFVIEEVLGVTNGRDYVKCIDGDCLDDVDYYCKFRYALAKRAPRYHLYHKGLMRTHHKES